jgi:hypothetical protein
VNGYSVSNQVVITGINATNVNANAGIHIVGVSNFVGINCNAPVQTLDVGGPLGLFTPSDGAGGTTRFAMYSYANTFNINPRTSGGAYNSIIGLVMASNGNVGINTSTPAQVLDVAGSIRAVSTNALPGNITVTPAGISASPVTPRTLVGTIQLGTGYGPYIQAYQAAGSYQDNTDISLCTNNQNNSSTAFERLTVRGGAFGGGSTYVGINCNAPQYTLDVAGTIRATGGIHSYSASVTNPTANTKYALASGLVVGGLWTYCVGGSVNVVSGLLLVYRLSVGGTFTGTNSQLQGGSTQIEFTGSTSSWSVTYYGNNNQTFMQASITQLTSFAI